MHITSQFSRSRQKHLYIAIHLQVMLSKQVLEDLYVDKKMSSLQIADKFGMKHSRTIRKWMERYNIPRRTLSESRTIYPKTSFGGDLKTKAYLLGLRAGDFHAKRIHKIIRVQTTTTHPAQIELMKRSFGQFSHVGIYEFFNKKFNIKQWFIYCDMDESFAFLLEKPKEIPVWTINTDELFFCFLAGYADSESCWKILRSHKNAMRFVFQISTQDEKILKQIVVKLSQMGYVANFYLDTKAGITRQGKKSNKDMFRIMVYRTENIMNLVKIILPLSNHQEKIDKMGMIFESKNKKWIEVKDDILNLRNQIKNSRIQSSGLMYQSKS